MGVAINFAFVSEQFLFLPILSSLSTSFYGVLRGERMGRRNG